MKDKIAKIIIDNDFIRAALCFPDNAEIIQITKNDSRASEMIVRCDEFPEVENGEPIPQITPVMETRKATIVKDWGF